VSISNDKSFNEFLFVLYYIRSHQATIKFEFRKLISVAGKHKKKHRQQQKDQPLGQTVPGEGSGQQSVKLEKLQPLCETEMDEGSGQQSESVPLHSTGQPLCVAEMDEGSAQQYESLALEVPGTRHREYIKL